MRTKEAKRQQRTLVNSNATLSRKVRWSNNEISQNNKFGRHKSKADLQQCGIDAHSASEVGNGHVLLLHLLEDVLHLNRKERGALGEEIKAETLMERKVAKTQ